MGQLDLPFELRHAHVYSSDMGVGRLTHPTTMASQISSLGW
jgi:hypothetical protein